MNRLHKTWSVFRDSLGSMDSRGVLELKTLQIGNIKNCPRALQWKMVGKYGCPTLRMESACVLHLRVRHCQCGFPGWNNYLNILDWNANFWKENAGSLPPKKLNYILPGDSFHSIYNLVYFINPSWKMFSQKVEIFHALCAIYSVF